MTSCCINFAIISNGFTSPFGKKEKKNCHLYNTILSLYISYQVSTYHIKTLQEESAKKSNIPWIWRIIYGHKLPYMKKTKITLYEEDKKEEASMRCSLLHGSWDQILRRCPSVDRIVSALYLQEYSSDPFHSCTSYQATSEGVSRVMPITKFKNLNEAAGGILRTQAF